MLPIFRFDPIFKSVLWGGTRIAEFKGIPSQGDHIGESWELSPMPGHESVVADGEFKGMTLPQLLAKHGEEIMGEKLYKRYGYSFPLLIKFIDSTQDLSIQVHPDDALAAKRHNSLGKTEMWYSVLPTSTAYLYAGFSQEMNPEKFRKMVADSTIVDALKKYYTKTGDVFFLPAGRQLHVDESVDAINYADTAQKVKNVKAAPGTEAMIEDCNYFTTTLVNVDKDYHLDLADRHSFTLLIATKGNMKAVSPEGEEFAFPQGQTLLVPASMPFVELVGEGEVVTVYIR